MIERIVIILLGVSLVAIGIVAKKEIDSSLAERDMWRANYYTERRHALAFESCVAVDAKFMLCERKK